MSFRTWETIRVRYCFRVNCDVNLEAQLIYPADIIPDQPPQVVAHRCSHAFSCNMESRPSCIWAGTNPAYDPFLER